MNILVIGTIDTKGGAAQISWELRKKLKADGHIVNTFVRYKYSNESDIFAIPRKRYQDWLVKLFANDLTFARSGFIFKTKEYREADIVHFHNLHGNFFNLKHIARISREKPVVWTLHDIWAITGFASDSITLRNPHKKKFLMCLWDNTPFLFWMKKRIYERSKLHIVAVSEWLTKEVQKSILGKQDIIRIYNGVDTGIFKPHNKTQIRKELGLPLDKKIIGFNIRGWTFSNMIVDDYKDRDDVFFLSIGHSHVRSPNANLVSTEHLHDKKLLAKYFSAMDVFIYPTQGDTFGLVVAEAMTCGTPVVTFGVDALPELVAHEKTGYIAQAENVTDLKKGIEYVLNLSDEAFACLSMAARQRVENLFTVEKMYAEYLKLYKRILTNKTI